MHTGETSLYAQNFVLTIKGQSTGLFFSNAMSVETFVTRQKNTSFLAPEAPGELVTGS